MMQNLTLLLRSILVGRFYSLVSVAGLAIAIAAVILVSALLQHEYTFESNYSAADRIHRLNWINEGTGDRFATMFNPFSPQFAAETADVERAARVGVFEVLLERSAAGPGVGDLEQVGFVDADFFHLFDLDFYLGSREAALRTPNSIVITRAAAEKYFPAENALGQSLTLEGDITLVVSAIIEAMPATTHFPFHFIAPLETIREIFNGATWLDNWGSDSVYHYVLLNPGADPALLDRRLDEFRRRNDNYREWDVSVVSQPLTDIHFTPDLQNEMPVQDNILNILKSPRKQSDLTLFSAGALVLVLIASFNFMNLQVARGFGRSKQLGLLKVVGGSRKSIFRRLLGESVLFSTLALVVALMIVELSLGLFGRTIGVTLGWVDVLQPVVVFSVVGLTVLLGLLSGAYPAWLMAAQKPNLILKGEFSHGHGVQRIREMLVLLQFSVSIVLIAVALGIYAQIQFSLSTPLGFDAVGAAVIDIGRPEVEGDYDSLRVRIEAHPDVSLVSRGSIVPTGNLADGMTFDPDGGGPKDPVSVRMVSVDFDFLEALSIEMAAGRSFRRDFGADEFVFPTADNPLTRSGIILNEAAARRAGWAEPAQAVGQELRNEFNFGEGNLTIIMDVVGVVKDVHYRSLRSEVVPMLFFLRQGGDEMLVKTSAANPDAVARHIERAWSETVPEIPLRMEWLNDAVARLYDQESRILRLMAGVSVLGIAVACLGLFAVASLVTESRRKEVALRKVFGATMMQIVNLLSWKFLQAVLVANLLAWPIAWFYMHSWLSTFVYRIDPGVMLFLIPGLITFVIAWLTVASQAWIVVRRKPIHALRHE